MLKHHWHALDELAAMRHHTSQFWNGSHISSRRTSPGWTPPVDVDETRDGYVVRAEVPGMSTDSIHVELKDQVLTLTGERAAPATGSEALAHRRERPVGRFARVFRFPKPVETKGVAASYRDGILTVEVPLQAEAKRRRVDVRAA